MANSTASQQAARRCGEIAVSESPMAASSSASLDDAPHQHAKLLLGGVGHGDDLGQVDWLQRVGQAQVSDDRQAQGSQAAVNGDDDLGYGGHANGVRANAAQEAILRARLQV